MKKLSIITPLYNTPRIYLQDVLASIEDYAEDIELILVNDSPNNLQLRTYLDKLEQSHIKVLHNSRNLGIFGAYYNGFLHANGEYCCILDHDDIFDPKNVLRAIAQKPDLIYTDEYKFTSTDDGDIVKEKPFVKPDFDILSTVFYLYTHHVTVLRTEIVQRQLTENTIPGKYTSVFDIHYLLEYIKAFAGMPMRVCHLPTADYGWRIHANSTAQDLGQKPSGYLERLKKVEEFLRYFGETPLLTVDPNVGYLVDGTFLSLHDDLQYPLKVDAFSTQLKEKQEFVGKKLTAQLEGGTYSQEDFEHFLRMFQKIPAKYLLRQGAFPLRIPKAINMAQIDPVNWKRQVVDVPFITQKASNLPGLILFEREKGKPDSTHVSTFLYKGKAWPLGRHIYE